MQQIDRAGPFRGNIVESGVGTTKNGFPQFVARLQASERYVEAADELAALGIENGPQWVDWTGYEAEMTGYFCLFGAVNKENPAAGMKPLDFQIESLNRAIGWSGSLSELGSGHEEWAKHKVTFWVENNEYNGVTSLKIQGIDAGDADPHKSIRVMDTDALKNLDAQFAGLLKGTKKPPVAASKPATTTKPAVGKPAAGAPSAATKPASAPASTAAKPASPSKAPAPKTGTKPPASATKPAAEGKTYEDGDAGQQVAWDEVGEKKGKASDDDLADKFIEACSAVAPGKDANVITGAQWGEIVVKTLALLAS